MKHFEQQTSSTLCSVLYLVHPKNQVPYFKALSDSNLTRLLLRKKQSKTKQTVTINTAFRSGLPISHEL